MVTKYRYVWGQKIPIDEPVYAPPSEPTGAAAPTPERKYQVRGKWYTEAEIKAFPPQPTPHEKALGISPPQPGERYIEREYVPTAGKPSIIRIPEKRWTPGMQEAVVRKEPIVGTRQRGAVTHYPELGRKEEPWKEIRGVEKISTAVQLASAMAERGEDIGFAMPMFSLYQRPTAEGIQYKMEGFTAEEEKAWRREHIQEIPSYRMARAKAEAGDRFGFEGVATVLGSPYGVEWLEALYPGGKKPREVELKAQAEAIWKADTKGFWPGAAEWTLETAQKGVIGKVGVSYAATSMFGVPSGWVARTSGVAGQVARGALAGVGLGLGGLYAVEKGRVIVPLLKEEKYEEVFGEFVGVGLELYGAHKGFKAGYEYGKTTKFPVKYTRERIGADIYWKGLYTDIGGRVEPIFGKTGVPGDPSYTVGMPEPMDIAPFLGQIKGYEGWLPASRIGRKLIVRPEVYRLGGFEPQAFQKVKTGLAGMTLWETTSTAFMRDKFTRESSLLTVKETETALDFFKQRTADVEQFYGSFTAQPQMPEHLQRPWGDIDTKLRLEEVKATEFAKSLRDVMGEKFRISEQKPTLVEKRVGDKWVHAFDIHYVGEPDLIGLDPSVSKRTEMAYGFSLDQPQIMIEELPSQPLSEQMLRKGAASLIMFEDATIGALPHRAKDIPDFYATMEALRLSTPTRAGKEITARWVELHPEVPWATAFKEPVDVDLTALIRKPRPAPITTLVPSFGIPSVVSRPSPSIISIASLAVPSAPLVSVWPSRHSVSKILSSASPSMPSISKSVSKSISPGISPSVSLYKDISPSLSKSLRKSLSISPSMYKSLSISPSISKSISKSVSPPSPPSLFPPSIPYPTLAPPWRQRGRPRRKRRKVKGRRARRRYKYTPTLVGLHQARYQGITIPKGMKFVGVQAVGIRPPVGRKRKKPKKRKSAKARKKRYQRNFAKALGL